MVSSRTQALCDLTPVLEERGLSVLLPWGVGGLQLTSMLLSPLRWPWLPRGTLQPALPHPDCSMSKEEAGQRGTFRMRAPKGHSTLELHHHQSTVLFTCVKCIHLHFTKNFGGFQKSASWGGWLWVND